ncbi:hypothetical protein [Sphingomonas crocodyli]|uniref:Uncharacterized protein n=1 Tax=Sphingomonas crocodyli TaxID=1979270 RepID=A0A437M150_9SPHN|nr:hypothetical protein [Sphingomonas crocodyli]RVT91295.1 hypothetical protein EOD43_17465 [Sphingomonas crocodyli]
MAVLMLAWCSSAHAYDLGNLLREKPDGTFSTPKPLFEVERCLLLRDWRDSVFVYRTPDRPDESLVYFTGGFNEPRAIELRRTAGGTEVAVHSIAVAKAQECG